MDKSTELIKIELLKAKEQIEDDNMACAAHLRSALEIYINKIGSGGNLSEKITDAQKKGRITREEAIYLHKIRILCNREIHEKENTVSVDYRSVYEKLHSIVLNKNYFIKENRNLSSKQTSPHYIPQAIKLNRVEYENDNLIVERIMAIFALLVTMIVCPVIIITKIPKIIPELGGKFLNKTHNVVNSINYAVNNVYYKLKEFKHRFEVYKHQIKDEYSFLFKE